MVKDKKKVVVSSWTDYIIEARELINADKVKGKTAFDLAVELCFADNGSFITAVTKKGETKFIFEG